MFNELLDGTITQWEGWMIFAVVLAMAEIILPGVFLIWIAIAAAITGAVAWLLPVPLPGQVVLFALLCLASAYLGKRFYADRSEPSADPMLNDRAARLIGRTVTVVEAIADGEGRVKVDDGHRT